MEKVTMRVPKAEDFQAAGEDMITPRALPPLILSLCVVFLVSGNILMAAVASGVTTYAHALWARLTA